MNPNYNYIKIDFYGQHDNDTKHVLTYPTPYNPSDAAAMVWLNPIKDPRVPMRNFFPQSQFAYKIHRDVNGLYYSYIFLNPKDPRGGYCIITVFVCAKKEGVIGGKMMLQLLTKLRTDVFETNNLRPEAIEACLVACGVPQIANAMAPVSRVQPNSTQAWRKYSDQGELCNILQFTKQKEYATYGEVFFVPAAAMTVPPAGIQMLATPIECVFQLQSTGSARVSKVNPKLGETVTVTYEKPGFAPNQVSLKVDGTDSVYVQYQGSIGIIVQPQNMQFKKLIGVKVSKNSGRICSNAVVTVNAGNETVTLNYDPSRCIYQGGLSDAAMANAMANVTVSAPGCADVKSELSMYALSNILSPVQLTVNEQKVVVTLNLLCDGSQYKGIQIPMTPNGPGLNGLSRGSFHGFKAFPVSGGSNEYNVSLQNSPHVGVGPTPQPSRDSKKSIIPALISFVVGVLLAAGVMWMFVPSQTVQVTEYSNEPGETVQSGGAQDGQSSLEAQDLEYIRNNRTWRKGDFKSEKYQALYDAMISGNVNRFLAKAAEMKSDLDQANTIREIVQKVEANPSEADAVFRKISQTPGEINLATVKALLSSEAPAPNNGNETSASRQGATGAGNGGRQGTGAAGTGGQRQGAGAAGGGRQGAASAGSGGRQGTGGTNTGGRQQGAAGAGGGRQGSSTTGYQKGDGGAGGQTQTVSKRNREQTSVVN